MANYITSLECKGKFRVIRICPKIKNELNLTIELETQGNDINKIEDKHRTLFPLLI